MVGSALNQILAEKKNPLEGGVLTVSYINGGQYPNIITDTVTLGGNVRTLNNDLTDKVFDSIHSISRGICAGFGLTCDVTTTLGYPAAINVPEEIETVRSVTRDLRDIPSTSARMPLAVRILPTIFLRSRVPTFRSEWLIPNARLPLPRTITAISN